jgi:hypothetical protein
MPNKPWSRIHIDFAGPVDNFFYLVIVDAFSNWPEVFKMTSTTSAKTIECLEETFARQGLCDTIVSDNGPQLVSDEFEEFCKKMGIEHIKTAPYHPQSNGLAERFVALLKTGLKKLEGEGNVDRVLRKFLFCYRYTPSHALNDMSPFQVMTGRTMKTRLDLLKPVAKSLSKRDETMEQQFNNHHGAKWKHFEIGDRVFVKLHGNNKWKWTAGTVVNRSGAVNYFVKTDAPSGEREIKFHANQMKKRFNIIDEDDNNPLLDDFDINVPPRTDVEPEIVAQPNEEESEDDEEYEDAHEEEENVENQVEVHETPSRRSDRANAGKTQRYRDYVM